MCLTIKILFKLLVEGGLRGEALDADLGGVHFWLSLSL